MQLRLQLQLTIGHALHLDRHARHGLTSVELSTEAAHIQALQHLVVPLLAGTLGIITTNEIVMTNMLEISALIEILVEKGIVTEKELMGRIEKLRGKMRGR